MLRVCAVILLLVFAGEMINDVRDLCYPGMVGELLVFIQ